MNHIQKIIVIGGNHHNTLGVIRSLGRVGILPFVILTSGNESSFVLKSKYIQTWRVVNGSEEAIKLLMDEFATNNQKCVLIACHDGIASALDLNRKLLSPYFMIPGTLEEGKITHLMNKKNMGECAERVGLCVPHMMVINKNNFEINDKNISYPCITKPIESTSGSKSEITICNNYVELKSFFFDLKNNNNFIIQKFIKKQFEFQLIGCSLGFGAEIIIPGVSIILRQSRSSNTGFLHYTMIDDTFSKTIEKTKAFIRDVGYSGLFSVEFLRDKDGQDYFLEMNFRNDGNTIAVANAGINLPYIWYLYCAGVDYRKEVKPIHDEFVMPEFAELSLYQQGIISRKEWKQDMKTATSFMDYDPEDLAPTEGWKKYRRQKFRAQIVRLVKLVYKKRK